MKEKFKEILDRVIQAITSKKFFCLGLATWLLYIDKINGSEWIVIASVYIGVETAQNIGHKWMDR